MPNGGRRRIHCGFACAPVVCFGAVDREGSDVDREGSGVSEVFGRGPSVSSGSWPRPIFRSLFFFTLWYVAWQQRVYSVLKPKRNRAPSSEYFRSHTWIPKSTSAQTLGRRGTTVPDLGVSCPFLLPGDFFLQFLRTY